MKSFFLLGGNIMVLKDAVLKAQSANKNIYIHVDLMEGLSKDLAAIKIY